MCEFPYMKLYPADLAADTLDLSAADFGSYMLLLVGMWRKGGKLRLEHGGLARIARRPSRHWLEIWGRLASYFRVSEDGLWITQKRLNAELEDARDRRDHASKAAKAREAGKRSDLGEKATSEAGKMPASPPRKPLENNNPPSSRDDPGSINRACASQSASKKDSSTVEIRGGVTSIGAALEKLALSIGCKNKPLAKPDLYTPNEIAALEHRFAGKLDDIPKRIPGLVFWATETEGMVSENEIKRAIYRALEKRAGGKELEAERVAA